MIWASPCRPFPARRQFGALGAKNGVLLLNTCLTVEEGQPASHAGKGWEVLTDAIIRQVAEQGQPTVFMLWGSHAQAKQRLIPADRGRLVLTSDPPLAPVGPAPAAALYWQWPLQRGPAFGQQHRLLILSRGQLRS